MKQYPSNYMVTRECYIFKARENMTTAEIKANLCDYDKRNPDYIGYKRSTSKEDCYCDNCFRGKTQLAEELLKVNALLEIIEEHLK